MLGKTSTPREDLTADQVDGLLVATSVRRGFGLELLDAANRFVEDISADCRGFTVGHDNTAEVHGRLSVQLTRELEWGKARVRPYRTLTRDGVTAKFYRGVYVLTTPVTNRGRTPITYTVSGQDVLQPLTRHVGDTYVVTAGTTYLQALRDLLLDAGIAGTVRLDGTRQETALPADRVWALTSEPRWLDVANDLLAEIAYTDLYASDRGEYRATPFLATADRPVERTIDTGDLATDVIARDRSEEYDAWSAPNVWRFVRRQMPYQPIIGDGIVEYVNQSDGESSIDSVGEVPVTHWLDVADQATLEAEGLRIVEADRRAERRFTISSDPWPLAWHRDVVEYRDAGSSYKLQVTSWEEPTSGRGTWVLGGGPGGSGPARPEQQATATIVTASPLTVVVDGATTASAAAVLDAAAYAIGDRVTVTVRNPQPPLVQGAES